MTDSDLEQSWDAIAFRCYLLKTKNNDMMASKAYSQLSPKCIYQIDSGSHNFLIMEGKPMYRFMILFMGLVLLLAACGGDTSDSTPEPTSTDIPTATPEPTEPVNAGETVFRTRCASCHNLNDMDQVGPGLAGMFSLETLPGGQEFSEEALVNFITQGGGTMQGIKLDSDEIDELIAYLREATAE